jgi:DNA replication and repair protein RecF
MYLKSIHLENFRNYENLKVEFDPKPGIFILMGQNAQGKTNFLESIFMLSFPRSFRAKQPKELVRFNQNYYTAKGEFASSHRDFSLKIGYQVKPVKRSYQQNDIQIDLKEYLTNFQTVIFTPEDIEIISGSPSERRRLIDTILSQTDREYFEQIVGFSRILKQRNALLKRIRMKKANVSELKFWNDQLINHIEEITKKRKEFFEIIQAKVTEIYQEISEDHSENIEIEYSYSGKSREGHYDSYRDILESLLVDEQQREVEVGHTVIGSHRDDFTINLNKKSVAQYCSRGEKRSFMLALKIAEISYLEEITSHKPILLLDDVFSELDKNRRNKLLELTKNYQTFITTVEKSYFADYDGEICIFSVEENGILGYNK